MTQFHLHLRTAMGVNREKVRIDFPDLEAAFLDAYGSVLDMTRMLTRGGLNLADYTLVITDADGVPLVEMPFIKPLRDTRRPPRPGSQDPRLSMRSASARDLALATARQVEAIRQQARVSREWVRQARLKYSF